MRECVTTMIVFTLTNIIHFGIVIKVLTPPIICYATCITSALVGTTFLSSFLIMEHTIHSSIKWIYKTGIISTTVCIPFLSSIGACVALHQCFDENWYVWIIQGSTIPAMFWTTYRMFGID
jgi:hypothetical protein